MEVKVEDIEKEVEEDFVIVDNFGEKVNQIYASRYKVSQGKCYI